MGLRDDIKETIDSAVDSATDGVADKTGKKQVGFEPSVCQGCPHRGTAPLYRCGLCGCPTISGAPLDQMGMVPEGCPREVEHERNG